MDTNGARALAQRLGDKSSDPVDLPPLRAVSEEAAPIFHWFGVEPPAALADQPKLEN
jgi:hypothetical protein